VDAADRFPPQARVYVPLCGKTVDLVWLRDRGHEVFGCEFVAGAVRDFLREQGLTAATERRQAGGGAPFECHRTRGLSVLQGDALELDPGLIGGPVDVVFDRAALVALDPACRNRYVDGLHRLLRPGGHVLLIAFAYDQTRVEGPPWSVDATTIERLFGDRFFIETLPRRGTRASRQPGWPRWRNAAVGSPGGIELGTDFPGTRSLGVGSSDRRTGGSDLPDTTSGPTRDLIGATGRMVGRPGMAEDLVGGPSR
jgi:thiopurine S-methyltransferase